MGPTADQGGRPLGIKKFETFFWGPSVFSSVSVKAL